MAGTYLYNCVMPLVTNSLQSGQFSARSTASVHVSLCESSDHARQFYSNRCTDWLCQLSVGLKVVKTIEKAV